jgi:hypothetical protein
MDDLLAALEDVAVKADPVAASYGGRVRSTWKLLEPAVGHAARAWSGSRLGYHAEVYIKDMRPVGGEVWDAAYGRQGSSFSNQTRGNWAQWDRDAVFDWLLERAGRTREDVKRFDAETEVARAELRSLRDRVLPLVDVLAARDVGNAGDAGLQRAQGTITSLKGDLNEDAATKARLAGRYQSADRLAMSQGARLPVHEHVEMQFARRLALAGEFETLARECRYVRGYLRTQERVAAALDPLKPRATATPTNSCRVLLLAANPDVDLALDEEICAARRPSLGDDGRPTKLDETRDGLRLPPHEPVALEDRHGVRDHQEALRDQRHVPRERFLDRPCMKSYGGA